MIITTSSQFHGYEAGDTIYICEPDNRWWMRLWHFITFRPKPVRTIKSEITEIIDSTTLTLAHIRNF